MEIPLYKIKEKKHCQNIRIFQSDNSENVFIRLRIEPAFCFSDQSSHAPRQVLQWYHIPKSIDHRANRVPEFCGKALHLSFRRL